MTNADAVKLCAFIESVWPNAVATEMREAACRDVLSGLSYSDAMSGIRLLATERPREFAPTFFEVLLAIKRLVAPWLASNYDVAKAEGALTYREAVRRYEKADTRLYSSRVASPQSDTSETRERRIRSIYDALLEEARLMSISQLAVRTDMRGLRVKGRLDTERRELEDRRTAQAEADHAAGHTFSADDDDPYEKYSANGQTCTRAREWFKREYYTAYGKRPRVSVSHEHFLPRHAVIARIEEMFASTEGVARELLMFALSPTLSRLEMKEKR